MRQLYVEKNFHQASLNLIEVMNGIILEYQQQRFVLTVRQLYYQLVARDVIANTMREYKRVAYTVNDAKLAGLIDWDAIEDRTRAFVRQTRWGGGKEILTAAAEGFHMDMWANQDYRVFVVVEKEALVGVLQNVCSRYDVPLLAARGYPSGSVLREFAQTDMLPTLYAEQTPFILHLGDHDPSGMDMTRDLRARFDIFCEWRDFELKRIALTMDQVQELNPPENPAKTTDSRFDQYRAEFGESSWELDALSPAYIADLIKTHVEEKIDQTAWSATLVKIEDTKKRIRKAARTFK